LEIPLEACGSIILPVPREVGARIALLSCIFGVTEMAGDESDDPAFGAHLGIYNASVFAHGLTFPCPHPESAVGLAWGGLLCRLCDRYVSASEVAWEEPEIVDAILDARHGELDTGDFASDRR
jgi:hypothetical protein